MKKSCIELIFGEGKIYYNFIRKITSGKLSINFHRQKEIYKMLQLVYKADYKTIIRIKANQYDE